MEMTKNDLKNKLTSPEEAVKLVHDHDRIFIGFVSNITPVLSDALWERRQELNDITIISGLLLRPTRLYTEPTENQPFKMLSLFLGPFERTAMKIGRPSAFTSLHLSQVDDWFHNIGKVSVVFISASMPDENGNVSFGVSGGSVYRFLLDTADRIILELNPNMPYVYGQDTIFNIKDADAIVMSDKPIPEMAEGEPDEITEKISDQIVPLIPDGATIQLGIGGLSSAIGNKLTDKNDLGIFSEMLCPSMVKLMKNGNVTNKYKGFMDGKSVYAFAAGDKAMYDFMDHNENIYNAYFSFANDPRMIMKNKKMISINTAMAINLYGETAADAIGYHQYSAIGGQLDYVRGAQWSEGGKSIIAMDSSYIKNGKRYSKINFTFPEGTPISTPRSDIEYVATEYGCIDLKHLTMADRVRAMISLAHPDFRDELTEKARHVGLI